MVSLFGTASSETLQPFKKLCQREPKTRTTDMLLTTLVKPFCMHTIFRDLSSCSYHRNDQLSSVQLAWPLSVEDCYGKSLRWCPEEGGEEAEELEKPPHGSHGLLLAVTVSVVASGTGHPSTLSQDDAREQGSEKPFCVAPAWLRLQFLTCSRICGQQHKECLQTYPLFFTSVKNCPG